MSAEPVPRHNLKVLLVLRQMVSLLLLLLLLLQLNIA